MGARAISEGIASKEFSAREVTEATYARIERLEPAIHAFNQLTPDLAMSAADRIDALVAAGGPLPPLAGVPAGIKDNMNLVGTRTTCGARMLEDYDSVYDCTAVRRLLDAGALPVGKCNMDEFAFGSSTENSAFGPTRNPWDLERVPGGSSGGSAAAVAAGMVTIALGSDTGGSIRQPGALTGTVAMKPTYGRVSRYGLVAFASSLDQIGPFSRSVEDSALVCNAIAGKDPFDATSVDTLVGDYTANLRSGVEGMRVGIVRDMLDLEGCDPEVREATVAAAQLLAEQGALVDEVDLPTSRHGLAAYYVIGPAEASSNLARFDGIRYGRRSPGAEDVVDLYMRSRAEGFGAETIRRIMLGTYTLSAGYYDAYYGQAQKARTLIAREFAEAFQRFDVLLTPTSPTVAFKLGERAKSPVAMYLSDVYTVPLNLAGLPGVSVPTALAPSSGLPIGVQVVADHFDEATMFRAAFALESSAGFVCTPARE
ncbi:MAG: Asp-tRNA(Asn)/Glu-tRNA(Gln) amidotransferase subunit GatA [Actinomycetia bacterium]|nr:Asp-tRNA(Asn)/Glu-tRNA(Gln) amidotransferase subunit GatA [Actinomycetes bacterium]